MSRMIASWLFGALAAACLADAAAAQDFYQGKTIRIVVGSTPGVSYDTYARILARHLGGHIRGNPTIVVQDMPGAQGLLATNNVYNVVPKDGTVIGMFNRSTILASVIGNEQARFKSEDFHWLGTPASFSDNAYIVVIRSSSPHRSAEDIRNAREPVTFGNSGSPPIRLLKPALGLNAKVVEGYGKSDLDLAFERGEVDGQGIAYSNLIARHADWVDKKLARPVIQFGRTTRLPALADVPTARELAKTAEDRALIGLTEAALVIAYPFALPPGVPADRIAVLKAAFREVMNDAAFRDEILKAKLEYSPKDGDELQDIVADLAKAPAAAIRSYKEIVGTGGGD